MKIQFLSDLHNEGLAAEYRIEQTDAEVVVLAGDINSAAEGIYWAGRESARLGKPIIYVSGNHEYYGLEYCSLLERQRTAAREAGVHFLERDAVVIDGVRFLGATLWTDFSGQGREEMERAKLEAKSCIRDFHRIRIRPDICEGQRLTGLSEWRQFDPDDAASLFAETVRWLMAQLEQPFAGKTVVVTHFGPHPGTQHPDFPVGPLSPYFWSDLTALVEQVDLWIYGHSHGNIPPLKVGRAHVVSNQCGYLFEETSGFEAGLCVTI